MRQHGFVRVAVASPVLRVADVEFNVNQTLHLMKQAGAVELLLFPECNLTGYTCGDLFHFPTLLRAAEVGLCRIVEESKTKFGGVVVLGLPLLVGQQVFNVAAVVCRGTILGVVPKSYLPNYKEFYDARYFSPASSALTTHCRIEGYPHDVPFGTKLLFTARGMRDFCFGVEICEDLWTPIPPSSQQALAGATVLLNLSASPESIGKKAYRKQLVLNASAQCIAGYLYSASGVGESSTDLVFSGHGLIAEYGVLLQECSRFSRQDELRIADLDLEHLVFERVKNTSFHAQRTKATSETEFQTIEFELADPVQNAMLLRQIDAHPFVPSDPSTLQERCEEIFAIQVAGLAKRLEHIGKPNVSLGVSGGLDSTLALLVVCKAFDLLGLPRSAIQALTMPGFGTTQRSLGLARQLMRQLGVTEQVHDIRALCFEQFKTLGAKPFGIDVIRETLESFCAALLEVPIERQRDLTFENVQARVRTSLLMNTAFTIGTGDLSELALGWCTYNADHISMYNPNVSIPKTLVRFLVRWVAGHEFTGDTRLSLHEIASGMITPELLPTNATGEATQSTEASVGPYELVDFFLYHFLRWGSSPQKILDLAQFATFDQTYSSSEIRHWLKVFLTRFFASQFKRSCLPDGPKVGSVSLSPRGDWRMPSDAVVTEWIREL